MRGIRKEYGEHRFQDPLRGKSRPANPGPQQQSTLHGARLLSPLRAPQRNVHQVHPHNPHSGTHRSGSEARSLKKKGGIDCTSLNETNEWRRDFESDSDGELQDHHLFTGSDSPTSMGRSASPGPLPYGTAKVI